MIILQTIIQRSWIENNAREMEGCIFECELTDEQYESGYGNNIQYSITNPSNQNRIMGYTEAQPGSILIPEIDSWVEIGYFEMLI
ncbi:hypothetical protein [Clostridium fungisolvens]|uniref:Uncharacterized protein n=1 Tax=Clostridium fungisolvens TaxID=1604897 RepID=A0A6V8SHW8_9CLOT|nr:hypothetical protein [Clostridium fungisolvens]GFP76381.1 hypothetical protein bsdtw1_02483 [Clostridium fungisolvens]